jgi:protein TonB
MSGVATSAPRATARRDLRGAGWAASAILVLGVHAGLLLLLRGMAPPDAGDAPTAPILMDLAPTPSAPPPLPGLTPADIPPPPPQTAAPDPLPPEPIPPEPVVAAPPEPPPMPAVPLPAIQLAVAPVEPPRPRPPTPRIAPRPARAPTQPSAAVIAPQAPAQAAPPAALPGPAAAPPSGEIAATWQGRLLAHLARYKRFPEAAQRRGEQGTVLVRFAMDRGGHVLSASIARGSGYADLDAEAQAWIARADPLPALPPEMAQARMEVTVPLRFNLR